MNKYNNIRRAVKLLRRNDGVEFCMSLEQLLKWAPHLEEIDLVLGRMSKSDFDMFVGCEGEDYARTLRRRLPQEWGATKKMRDQLRKSLRLADQFLNSAY